MNCMNCGKSLEPNFKYCPECATPVLLIASHEPIEDVASSSKSKGKKNSSLKRIFLIIMIVALSMSGLMGISVILFGSGSQLEGQILLTTTAIGGFSLLCLCCSPLLERRRKRSVIALLGIVMSMIGLSLSFIMIWFEINSGNSFEIMFKWLISTIVICVGLAHSCLLLLIKPQKLSVWVALFSTVVFIFILVILLLLYIFEGFGYDVDWYFKLMGIVAILVVLGTLISPIIGKISKRQV